VKITNSDYIPHKLSETKASITNSDEIPQIRELSKHRYISGYTIGGNRYLKEVNFCQRVKLIVNPLPLP
jgi:hypothetical protein